MSEAVAAEERAPAAEPGPQRCPLCGAGAEEAAEVERIPYARIWAELERQWGARFSPPVVERHTPAPEATLLECDRCGLQWFMPLNPGDAAFYAQLSTTASDYYSPERWEYGVVRPLAAGRRVLDAGCGYGHFLRVLRGVAAGAVGIETNPEAVARARGDGLDVRLATIEEFAAEHRERFDLACSFHVLEHLPEVMPFTRAMLACVRPGGTLVLSVPNRLRMRGEEAVEPLDCPPHHVSRWHPRQFAELAARLGVELRAVRHDPPGMLECRTELCGRGARALAWAGRPGQRAGYFLGRLAGRAVFSPTLYPWLAARALPARWGIYRHPMVAVMVRP